MTGQTIKLVKVTSAQVNAAKLKSLRLTAAGKTVPRSIRLIADAPKVRPSAAATSKDATL